MISYSNLSVVKQNIQLTERFCVKTGNDKTENIKTGNVKTGTSENWDKWTLIAQNISTVAGKTR